MLDARGAPYTEVDVLLRAIPVLRPWRSAPEPGLGLGLMSVDGRVVVASVKAAPHMTCVVSRRGRALRRHPPWVNWPELMRFEMS